MSVNGSNNPNWKGDKAAVQTGRSRAERWYVDRPCEKCGNILAERHHKDGNTLNNDETNIAFLCRRHHMIEDGRLEVLKNKEASKTSCPKGHPYSHKDKYGRKCKICINESSKACHQRLRDAGLCSQCGDIVVHNRKLCSICLEKDRLRHHVKKEKKKWLAAMF